MKCESIMHLALLRACRHPLPFERVLPVDDRYSGHGALGPHRRSVVMRAVEVEVAAQVHIELTLAHQMPSEPRPVHTALDRRADRIDGARNWRKSGAEVARFVGGQAFGGLMRWPQDRKSVV